MHIYLPMTRLPLSARERRRGKAMSTPQLDLDLDLGHVPTMRGNSRLWHGAPTTASALYLTVFVGWLRRVTTTDAYHPLVPLSRRVFPSLTGRFVPYRVLTSPHWADGSGLDRGKCAEASEGRLSPDAVLRLLVLGLASNKPLTRAGLPSPAQNRACTTA